MRGTRNLKARGLAGRGARKGSGEKVREKKEGWRRVLEYLHRDSWREWRASVHIGHSTKPDKAPGSPSWNLLGNQNLRSERAGIRMEEGRSGEEQPPEEDTKVGRGQVDVGTQPPYRLPCHLNTSTE